MHKSCFLKPWQLTRLYAVALHALVSSLAPEGGSDGKLSDAQVDALTARLDHILGNTGDAPAERRNEKGQVCSAVLFVMVIRSLCISSSTKKVSQ